ncbi:MAG TPA: lipopolysaccharide heptosyltransferase II [Candidatus Tectomicrobia bacterium]|nr:lipopolysaccharide heptosyltransferase II [Candidatus Tectomicrobia bacterium]
MHPISPHLDAVLVVGPNWLGDAVMSAPVLTNLRRGLPKARIDLLVPRHVAPLFEDYPHIDRVVIRDDQRPWRIRLSQVRALRRGRYGTVLLLPNSFRAALYAWLVGSPVRIGYATDGRRWLLSHPVSAIELQPGHQIDAYLRLVVALGLPVVERLPVLAPTLRAEQEADRLWSAQGWGRDDQAIGICPGAAFGPAKRWWPERFAALADRLISSGGFRVVFFGSSDEASLVEHIRAHMTHVAVSLAGQDTLGSFMALSARCAVMITNDSGSMHIASAVGTRVVALFGPTDPARTAPASAAATVLRRDLACSPCFRTMCPYSDHPCMRLIEVEDVYQAVLNTLGLDR